MKITQRTECNNCIYANFHFYFQLSLLLQRFQYILQLIYQVIFYALTIFIVQILPNIKQFVTFTLIITRILNQSFMTYTFIDLFFTLTPAFIIISTLFIITNTCVNSTFAFICFMLFYVSCFISSWHWMLWRSSF